MFILLLLAVKEITTYMFLGHFIDAKKIQIISDRQQRLSVLMALMFFFICT